MSDIENRHIIAWISIILSKPDQSNFCYEIARLLASVNHQIKILELQIKCYSYNMATMVEATHEAYEKCGPEDLEYNHKKWEKYRVNKREAERLIIEVYDLYKELFRLRAWRDSLPDYCLAYTTF